MHAARALAPLRDDAFDELSLAQFRTAADEFVAAERFNADRPEHRTNLGSFFAERGDADTAEAELRAALTLDRGFVPAWVNLADLMRVLGREQYAESTLREGLAVAPEAAALHHALGLSLVRQQRKTEALEELKRATELEPGNERFRYVYDIARREIETGAGR
jgi:Flp pilus assembly protein TadD